MEMVQSKNCLFQQNIWKQLYDFNRLGLGLITKECDVKMLQLDGRKSSIPTLDVLRNSTQTPPIQQQ